MYGRTLARLAVALATVVALGCEGDTSATDALFADDVAVFQSEVYEGIGAAVAILVDTSGSMERMPNTATRVEEMPSCGNVDPANDERNRWSVTLEALTGSFGSDFACSIVDRASIARTEYDYGYHLPKEIAVPSDGWGKLVDPFTRAVSLNSIVT